MTRELAICLDDDEDQMLISTSTLDQIEDAELVLIIKVLIEVVNTRRLESMDATMVRVFEAIDNSFGLDNPQH
jgi:hypothetical protein